MQPLHGVKAHHFGVSTTWTRMKHNVPPACLEEKTEKDMGKVEQEGTGGTDEKASSVKSEKLQGPQ